LKRVNWIIEGFFWSSKDHLEAWKLNVKQRRQTLELYRSLSPKGSTWYIEGIP
jgi:hypothetical protein